MWYEEPESLQSGEYLTLGASPEEIHKVYKRFGALFAADAEGTLALKLELDLGEVTKSLKEERTSWGAATP